jgi:hypothetical protein
MEKLLKLPCDQADKAPSAYCQEWVLCMGLIHFIGISLLESLQCRASCFLLLL